MACAFARDALERRSALPARPALAELLRPHAAARRCGSDRSGRTAAATLGRRYPDHARRNRFGRALRSGAAGGAGRHDAIRWMCCSGPPTDQRRLSRRHRWHSGSKSAGRSRRREPGRERAIEIGGGTAATTHAARQRASLPDSRRSTCSPISRPRSWPPPTARSPPGRRCEPRPSTSRAIRHGKEIERRRAGDLVDRRQCAPCCAGPRRVALRHACRLLAPGRATAAGRGHRSARPAWTSPSASPTAGRARTIASFARIIRLVDQGDMAASAAAGGLQDIVAVAELGGQAVLTGVAGPATLGGRRARPCARRRAGPAAASGTGRTLPHGRLDGVVSLSGLEAGDGLADLLALSRDADRAARCTAPAGPDGRSPNPRCRRRSAASFAPWRASIRRCDRAAIGLADAAGSGAALSVSNAALDDGEDRVAWREANACWRGWRHLPPLQTVAGRISRLAVRPDTDADAASEPGQARC